MKLIQLNNNEKNKNEELQFKIKEIKKKLKDVTSQKDYLAKKIKEFDNFKIGDEVAISKLENQIS